MSKTFIDTSILVYAMDQTDPVKQKTARSLLRSLQGEEGDAGVLSTQVLQEFYLVCTKKLQLDPLLAKGILQSLSHSETVNITPEDILRAIDCSVLNRLSFWDSLIIVSAAGALCDRIITEGLTHGQVVCGVRIENPFV